MFTNFVERLKFKGLLLYFVIKRPKPIDFRIENRPKRIIRDIIIGFWKSENTFVHNR